jgi:hypothetical protein
MESVGRCTIAARRGVVLVLALLAALGALAIPATSGATDGINLRLDFETGNSSQFSGLECPHPATQLQVYTAGTPGYPAPRQGTYAARFSETPNDVWSGNNMVRCLGARYDSGETTGDNYYYGFSLYIPTTGLGSNLIWELHHPSSLYSLAACSVAPFAVLATSTGGLQFRISTGNCTVGSGYAYWYPHISLPGLESAPRGAWIDFLVHIAFSETNGTTEVSYRVGNNPWPATPQLARYGIPTMPYANSVNVHNVKLYTEMGLYTGYTPYTSSDAVFLDGYRRGTSRDSVMAEFLGSAPLVVAPVVSSVPVVSGSAEDGGVVSSTAGVWSNSPTSFGYVWQSSRDGGATWQAVAGATSSAVPLVDGLVGARVRSVVTATNSAGSASAVSAATAVVAPPSIVQSVVAGQTLTGTVDWTATPSVAVKQVVFGLDGNTVTYTDTGAPFAYQLDTTKLANGTHTLGLTVTLLDGTVVSQPYQIGTVTVSNKGKRHRAG